MEAAKRKPRIEVHAITGRVTHVGFLVPTAIQKAIVVRVELLSAIAPTKANAMEFLKLIHTLGSGNTRLATTQKPHHWLLTLEDLTADEVMEKVGAGGEGKVVLCTAVKKQDEQREVILCSLIKPIRMKTRRVVTLDVFFDGSPEQNILLAKTFRNRDRQRRYQQKLRRETLAEMTDYQMSHRPINRGPVSLRRSSRGK